MSDFITLQNGINHIKKIREADKKLSDAFSFVDTNVRFISLDWIEDDYIKLLSITLNDTYDWISYYVYECDFGKKKREVTVKGKPFELRTVRQLYKLITTKE